VDLLNCHRNSVTVIPPKPLRFDRRGQWVNLSVPSRRYSPLVSGRRCRYRHRISTQYYRAPNTSERH